MLYPEINDSLRSYIIVNETAWVLDIFRRFFFNSKEGQDVFIVAVDYIKGQFILDIISTIPQLASFFDSKFVAFKLLRFSHLSSVMLPLRTLFSVYFSNRDKQYSQAMLSAF